MSWNSHASRLDSQSSSSPGKSAWAAQAPETSSREAPDSTLLASRNGFDPTPTPSRGSVQLRYGSRAASTVGISSPSTTRWAGSDARPAESAPGSLARDFDSGDRPGPGAGRVRAGQLGADVALLQLDDLRLGSRAIDLEHRVLCSAQRVLGEEDLGMRDAHAG